MGSLTDPRSLKPSLGREGWCQRLLTELILEDRCPAYNTRRRPPARGRAFLGALDEISFGVDAVSTRDMLFVDEIDLPARHPDERGCAPDYTVFVEDRCWMVELKTERGSHRPRQIPDYFERAHHYHPELQVDITYLTGRMRAFKPPIQPWERYAHVGWTDIIDAINSVWSSAPDDAVRTVMTVLLDGISHLDEPLPEWWARLGYQIESTIELSRSEQPDLASAVIASDVVAGVGLDPALVTESLALAIATGEDGRQRAIGFEAGGLEALDELRLVLRQACRSAAADSPLRVVRPWLWGATSSGGQAKTAAGSRTGFELRLSRSRTEPTAL